MPWSGESETFSSTHVINLEGKAQRNSMENSHLGKAVLTDSCRGNLQTNSSGCHRCPCPCYHWHHGRTVSKVTKWNRCESAEKPTQIKKFNDLLILGFRSAIMIMILNIITTVMKMQILFYSVHWTGNSCRSRLFELQHSSTPFVFQNSSHTLNLLVGSMNPSS